MPRVDPRLKTAPRTIAEQIADRSIRHQLFLEGFKTQQVNTIVGNLNKKLIPELIRLMEKNLGGITNGPIRLTPVVRQKLRQLSVASAQIISGRFDVESESFRSSMKAFALSEAEFNVNIMNQSFQPFGIEFVLPAETTITAIVENQPMQGTLLRKWFTGLKRTTQSAVMREINIGILQGEPITALRNRLIGTGAIPAGPLNKVRRDAAAIVRTAVNHVSTQARERTYDANDDIIKGVQIVATLDSRTTLICQGLDGQVFPINEGPRPPFHFVCRTTTTPVLKSFRELGIDLDDAPPGTRASLNGQVPSTQTYGEWLKGQPSSVQNVALGPTRAKLFREGKVNVQSFTNDKQRVLTLNELKRQEKLSADDLVIVR